ncbi:trihelix transcription factor ASR3-like [Zingiber officinale]|uniref:Myb/SANT-like DNA-binding domain-containing protein n=1 Tax=Zingiber officinale TaxID=94328 RepID=A0A8J5H9L8_ZINOF|nr:trihelix transcription factor ASR3-like [Zingiber officinale]KAG6523915.1 hypothetical protein ZIOFF_013803 [Zingiber officinale]
MANAVGAGGSNGHGGGGGTGGGGRAARLPRWTRQEILVLIQGKRVVESRGRVRGRGGGGVGGGGEEGTTAAPVEPKWASVSSYCWRHGVNRGAVQCRKRWSNLAGDFKKIKEWEAKGKESFWSMRNDIRRERRLPGFFDREVYDILDGVALPPEQESETHAEQDKGKKESRQTAAAAAVVDEEEVVFDTGRTAAEDGLFSDFEEEEEEEEDPAPPPQLQPMAAVPISEKQLESTEEGRSESDQATAKGKQEGDDIPEKGSPSHQGLKRRRPSAEAAAKDSDLQGHRLIEVLERNSRMLTAQLEAQHLNCQLDRDQRKDQANALLNVLGKLADALGKIADKL